MMKIRSSDDIDPLFSSIKLNRVGINEIGRIRLAFTDLLDILNVLCKDGREFSIVKTKLEEASFFAIKSASMNEDNQE